MYICIYIYIHLHMICTHVDTPWSTPPSLPLGVPPTSREACLQILHGGCSIGRPYRERTSSCADGPKYPDWDSALGAAIMARGIILWIWVLEPLALFWASGILPAHHQLRQTPLHHHLTQISSRGSERIIQHLVVKHTGVCVCAHKFLRLQVQYSPHIEPNNPARPKYILWSYLELGAFAKLRPVPRRVQDRLRRVLLATNGALSQPHVLLVGLFISSQFASVYIYIHIHIYV